MSIIDLRGKKPIKRRLEKQNADFNDRLQKPEGIVWQIPEYEYKPKDVSWFWLSLIVAIILIAFAIWQKNVLFAIFIIIAFLTLNYITNRFPPIWEIKINRKGISIGLPNGENKKFYLFDDIDGFDIHDFILEEENEIYKELVLKLKSKMSPFVKINIYPKDEKKINDFISRFVSKKEYERSLVDSMGKMFGF